VVWQSVGPQYMDERGTVATDVALAAAAGGTRKER
jgi:hypothetical protein